ncbi:LysR family transcriptional regulator [Novosphingobium sp. UBA1939]|uniref:LysR family transcriptional regulator n=1 Tax=Novosphingobium sp. UBA1939 TaxID=1946982 RepID=UPI0025D51F5F|nr:LysR family transcriptional regulator [Novosphingobium sp. UBA1939]
MELRHLRYFVAVANEQNFTRAAERLNVAQPPLSRQIRQLEEEIGADLFNRDSRPVRLTEAGRLLYEHAVPLLAGVDQLRDMMRRFTGQGQRRFVIGFVGSILFGPLPEVIRLFRDRASNVDVSVLECTTTEQIAALKEGRIDAGFGRLRFEDPAIRRIVLAEETLLAAVPADHPLALAQRPVHLADLIGDTLIAYPRPARPSYADQVFSIFHDAGLQPSGVQEVRELQTAIGLVAAHAGFTIVPESVQRFRRDDVAYLPIADSTARSPIMMIHRMGDVSVELAELIAISRDVHGMHDD